MSKPAKKPRPLSDWAREVLNRRAAHVAAKSRSRR